MDTEIENAAYKFAESQNDGSNFTAYYRGFIAGTKYKKSSNGVSLSMNIIPPMTDAHGKYWVQPDPRGFVLDDDYVLMDNWIRCMVSNEIKCQGGLNMLWTLSKEAIKTEITDKYSIEVNLKEK